MSIERETTENVQETTTAWQDDLAVEIMATARAFARRFLGRDEAHDVSQQVALTCLERLRSGRMNSRPEYFTKLVRRMVRHQVRDLRRRQASRDRREAEHGEALFDRENLWMHPDLMLELSDLESWHDETLERLSATCREVFVLVREGHATYRAVGNELGLTPLAVCAHMVRARAAFRIGLAQHGVAAPPTRRAWLRRERAS